jgi:hypothetical protein
MQSALLTGLDGPEHHRTRDLAVAKAKRVADLVQDRRGQVSLGQTLTPPPRRVCL